jgi:hypothetical protein
MNGDHLDEVKVQLKVNGVEIELNPFLRQIIYHTVTGMVKPLRGVETVKDISLQISSTANENSLRKVSADG